MTAMISPVEEIDRERWLVGRVGSRLCAIPLAGVIETMRALPIEAVSGAPRGVRGLSIIRGTPTPVIDLGLVLGEVASRPGRLVTVKAGARVIALAVDCVVGIWAIDLEECGALPPLLRDAVTDGVAGIGA